MKYFKLYTFLYYIFAFFYLPIGFIRGLIQKKYLKTFKERILGAIKINKNKKIRIWLQALSLGEAISALPLIETLEKKGYEIVLSATTSSGLKTFENRCPDNFLFSLPFDFSFSINRTIKNIKPDFFILIETDIWPNLLYLLKKNKIPSFLVGARLSPRSFKGYLKIKKFWGQVLNLFSLILCQSNEDESNFLKLGARKNILIKTGSLKFDGAQKIFANESKNETLLKNWPQGFWLAAGSTHLGEEEILLKAVFNLRKKFPDLKILIAPRDQIRFESVWKIALAMDPLASRRSANNNVEGWIFLLDTLGELSSFYKLSDCAFIGKSLGQKHEGGGHNPLEAAVFAKPLLFGPKMDNFKSISKDLLKLKVAITVNQQKDIENILQNWLQNPKEIKKQGLLAQEFILSQGGAMEKTISALEKVIFSYEKK